MNTKEKIFKIMGEQLLEINNNFEKTHVLILN